MEVEIFDAVKVKDQIVEIIQKAPDAMEVVSLLNEAGASYIFDLSVPLADVEKMMTSAQKAIGAGLYGFDSKYASVYNRSDVVIQARDNVNRLIGELGLQDDFSFAKQYTDRIEKNKTNTDSLDALVTQYSNDMHQYLQTGEHADFYALSTIGANIEALHVLSQMALLARDNKKLLEVMNNQNERVQMLKSLMEVMSGDENVKPYYETIEPVIKFFEERSSISKEDLDAIVPLITKARGHILQ